MKSLTSNRTRQRRRVWHSPRAGTALALCLLTVVDSGVAHAQTPSPAKPSTSSTGPLRDVLIRADGDGDVREPGRPAVTLSGALLEQRRANTLGETLAAEPGMAASGFAPGASRPIIRGQDGDRIQLMLNGNRSLDASALSSDHATTIEPLLLERVEVLRGPAALRYGGTAIGGVVNAVDSRIPTAPVDGVGGRAEVRAGGADSTRASVGVVDAGNGRVAVRADGFVRNSSDLRIPGYARSSRQRAHDLTADPNRTQPYGRVPNSGSHAEGGSLGASSTWSTGYLGLGAGALRSNYGTPAEEDIKVDLRKNTLDLAGEQRQLTGPFQTLRLRVNGTDYEHQEKERATGEVHTTFRNRGTEGRIEAEHRPLGGLSGMVGLQVGRNTFSALGDEAYVPRSRNSHDAVFAVERFDWGAWKSAFGARSEWARVASAGSEADGPARFGDARSRRFAAHSLSVSLERALGAGLSLVGTSSMTQRAPSHFELFADGPHAATGAWELGDPTIGKERAVSFEATLRKTTDAGRYSVTGFHTRFRNYLDLAPTGRWRLEDGTVLASDEPDALPEFAYRQVPATFRGIELAARWPVRVGVGALFMETRADYVQATRSDTGEPLPRIPPLRIGAALAWQREGWNLRGELTRVYAQDRVSPGESPTDGYTMANLWATWRLRRGPQGTWELFVRGTNLLNVEARNHASLLKDIAPMGGRGLSIGMRAMF